MSYFNLINRYLRYKNNKDGFIIKKDYIQLLVDFNVRRPK